MRPNFVLSGVAAGIRRNAAMTIALILSTSIALGFVGAAILANKEINKFKTTYEDKINISVYLCTASAYDQQQTDNELARREKQPERKVTCARDRATSVVETEALRKQLAADPLVKSAKFVSQEKALDLGKKQQPTLASYLRLGDLPASFTVQLQNLQTDYPKFAAKYDQIPGVDKVNNQISTIQTLLNIIDSAQWFSIVIALVVLIASILLIGNTIQVAANQRRNETSIMRLVGASRLMTELPFILETIIAVFIGGLIAIGFIGLGKHYLLDGVFAGQTKNGVIPNLSVNDILVAGGAGMIVGIVLASITAFLTLRLYVRL
jgi:cell division transport system permease protein